MRRNVNRTDSTETQAEREGDNNKQARKITRQTIIIVYIPPLDCACALVGHSQKTYALLAAFSLKSKQTNTRKFGYFNYARLFTQENIYFENIYEIT
jgi:hypothetical protein